MNLSNVRSLLLISKIIPGLSSRVYHLTVPEEENNYSSSSLHNSISQIGHTKECGLPPSDQCTLPHLPQSTEVLIGSTRVVSIRYIGPPASGNKSDSGSQFLIILWSTDSSFFIPIPNTKRTTPAIEMGAAKAREKGDDPE